MVSSTVECDPQAYDIRQIKYPLVYPVRNQYYALWCLSVLVDKRAEHVDIRNNGVAAVDLGGWVLQSEKVNQNCSLGGSIAPGQTLRIYAMTSECGFNCGFGSNICSNSGADVAVLWSPGEVEVSRY